MAGPRRRIQHHGIVGMALKTDAGYSGLQPKKQSSGEDNANRIGFVGNRHAEHPGRGRFLARRQAGGRGADL